MMASDKQQKIDELNAPYPLPMKWEWKYLNEICTINPRRPKIEREDNRMTSFVPMSSVDEATGRITDLQERPFVEIKQGYTYFEENDVLFAKITPCMENGKSALSRQLIDGFGFGSTEFHVLRHSEFVIPEWIHLFVRRKQYRTEAKKNFRGAVGQQRVPADFLKKTFIPLPPSTKIQKRIVARIESLVSEIKEARKLLDKMRKDAEGVLDAALEEFFSQGATVKWKYEASLGELTKIKAKQVDPRLPEYKSLPHIGAAAISSGTASLAQFRSAEEDGVTSGKYLFEPGDVLYSKIRPYLRKGSVVSFRGLCSADVYPLSIVDDRLTNDFLCWALLSKNFTDFAISKSGRARIPKINRKDMFLFRLNFPTKTEQKQITTHLTTVREEVKEMLSNINRDIVLLDQLEQSILERAFRGEL